ncbi:velvet factor-domain-containing protein [Zychaea mexicana]|uniref:velvet factor-domain-containing protein n=1 Tax=Zychaea mexicana TaxID=64656 RepID=UPI0022FEB180|nr:velvet factor-domain-containing protein [Zychaea mexicana]KAI9496566.1 velvet factor-domain-containing protein [Zychaea mexicana]
MQWENCSDDEIKKCLQSPFYFLVANIVTDDDPDTLLLPSQDYLSGSTVSSLYRLRDIDNSDGGFFVFGDLAVKKEGKYRLHFSLFEIVEGDIQNRKTMLSDTFTVFLPKRFPGPFEATFLSRTFCDQGVKMRIRKEHRLPSVSGRKRKVETMKQQATSIPDDHTSTMRTYKRKAGYIDNGHNQDVHFGRWQSSVPPSHQISSNSDDVTTASQHHSPVSQHHPLVPIPVSAAALPPSSSSALSCSSSITSSSSSSSSVSSSQHPPPPVMQLDPLPSPVTTPYSTYTEHQQLHRSAAQQSIPSPPPSSGQQHFSSDLAGYHFDKMGHSNTLHTLSRQLTPPPVLVDIEHHPHRYGDRLPPLRAIMGDMVIGPSLPPPSLPPPSTAATSSLGAPNRVSIHQLLSQ